MTKASLHVSAVTRCAELLLEIVEELLTVLLVLLRADVTQARLRVGQSHGSTLYNLRNDGSTHDHEQEGGVERALKGKVLLVVVANRDVVLRLSKCLRRELGEQEHDQSGSKGMRFASAKQTKGL